MGRCSGRAFGALALSLSVIGAGGGFAIPAYAQQTGDEDAARTGEIIVTAQKREEALQDVPISIAVVGGETLDKLQLNAATDLQYVVPGLVSPAQSGPRNFGFFIRGIGTNTFSSETIEPSMAYVIDGVVMGQSGATLVDLPDIAHIEVLRGPQSTLFGKNASAGVINIVTRRPSDKLEFRAGISAARPNDDIHAYGYLSGPLSDTLRFSISGRRSVRDGYIKNLPDGRRFNNRDEYGFRGKLEWQPSDKLRATLIGDYWKSDANCCIWTVQRFATPGPPATAPFFFEAPAIAILGMNPGRGNQFQTINGDVFANVKSYGTSLQLDYEIGGGHTLTSISAWRGFETLDGLDSDSSTDNFLDINFGKHDQDQISQELRLASPTGGVVDYVAGLYYFRQTVDSFTRQLFPPLFFLPFFNREVYVDVATRNMAAFGQANVHPIEGLTLTFGARWLTEKQTVGKSRTDTITLATDSARVRGKDDALTWRLGADYHFTPDIMAFASVTRGYKGGGFDSNIAVQALLPVGPERPTSYELGLRTAFPDAGLTLNLTGFYADIKGYQTASRDPIALTFPLTNGDAKTKGFEAELSWRPIKDRDFYLSGGVAYTDAKWGKFPGAPCAGGQSAAQGCIGGVQDLTGAPLPFAPKWAFNIGADYAQPIGGDLKLSGTLNYNYRSKQVIGFPNATDAIEPGYGLLSSAISLGDINDAWKVSVFGKNLTDEKFRTFAFNTTNGTLNQYRVYESRRIIGVAFDVAF